VLWGKLETNSFNILAGTVIAPSSVIEAPTWVMMVVSRSVATNLSLPFSAVIKTFVRIGRGPLAGIALGYGLKTFS
jgi:hypothetical protein